MTKNCAHCGIEITKGYKWPTNSEIDSSRAWKDEKYVYICPSCFDWLLNLELKDYDNYQGAL